MTAPQEDRPWAAERAVGAGEARALIEGQFPDLAPARVELLGAGWDNSAFAVNGEWVFRFPRRAISVALLEAELRTLPAIAGRLPLPVPVPTRAGRPGPAFPWPFAGHRMLPGRTADRARLDAGARAGAAEPLARFLAALHAIGAAEARALGVGGDPIERLDVAPRVQLARSRLAGVPELDAGERRRLGAVLDGARGLPRPRVAALVHGDLYARHLLVDPAGRPCGVIDWGDLHVGDPAADLALAHTFLPSGAQAAFRSAYGPIEEGAWRLARVRGLQHALAVVAYGRAEGDADLLAEGLTALRHLAAEDGRKLR
jgi:aminoglycoside phosphotransferase (APT) family kinase protein